MLAARRRPLCAATTAIVRSNVYRRVDSTLAAQAPGPSERAKTPQSRLGFEQQAPAAVRGHRRAIYIRPWDGVPSLQEGLAIVRAFELRFGKLRDIHFGRDFEVKEVYQSIILATFEDQRNYAHLPDKEINIQLTIPAFEPQGAGNTSLYDIQSLLRPCDKGQDAYGDPWAEIGVKNEDGSPAMKTLDVRFGQRNEDKFTVLRNFLSPPQNQVSITKLHAIGKEFALWGGFYTPRKTASIVKRELGLGEEAEDARESRTEEPHFSTVRMDAVRRKWASRIPAVAQQTEVPEAEPEEVAADADEIIADEPAYQTNEPLPPAEDPFSPSRDSSSVDGASVETAETTDTESAQPASPQPARQTKRERLLTLARSHAAGESGTALSGSNLLRERKAALSHSQTPLPKNVISREPEERKALGTEKAKKKAETQEVHRTVLDRLRKLWGGL